MTGLEHAERSRSAITTPPITIFKCDVRALQPWRTGYDHTDLLPGVTGSGVGARAPYAPIGGCSASSSCFEDVALDHAGLPSLPQLLELVRHR